MITKTSYEEVLQDFRDNSASFEAGESKLIASNTDFGVEIYVGGEIRYGSGLFPTITVFADDDVIFDGIAYSPSEFKSMLLEIYDSYLSPDFIDVVASDEKDDAEKPGEDLPRTEEDEEEEIGEQGSLLEEQVLAFLAVAYGYDPLEHDPHGDDILEKLKEAFCQACAEAVGDGIYRPCYIEDEKGNWVFERYPYETTVDAL